MRTGGWWMAAAAVLAQPAMAAGVEFAVAPNGNDGGPGTRARPFATVARARDAVRRLSPAQRQAPVKVVLRGGVYELAEALTFTGEDSGTAEAPVTYEAYPGEKPVLSGGRRIRGWKAGPDGLWRAAVPGARAAGGFFRQLFVDDARATRARWPDEDGVLRIQAVEDEVRSFTLSEPVPGDSLAGQGAELVVYENWSVTRGLVTASNGPRVTTATPMGWIGHGEATTASPGKPAFLEHARAFLDRPGEWFLDRAAGEVLYMPKAGQAPATTQVVAPRLERLIVLAGTREKPVRFLRFVGLQLEHVEFPLPAFGYNEIQAGHYGTAVGAPTRVQPVAVECVYADGCRFERCRVAHTGASGIGFGAGCRDCTVAGCTLEDIGGNGVMVGWRGKGPLQDGAEGSLDADWDDPADAPARTRVTGCTIQRCGAFSQGCVGVFAAFSADTHIDHNLVREMPYTGMSIGYRWNTNPSSQAGCVVEYNHIHDVMRLLADGGGIYTLGFQPGTVFRGNHIHDVHRSRFAQGGAPNNGFFVDEGSKGFLFEGNLVYGTSGESVRFNNCQREWHAWKDNLFGQETDPAARTVKENAGPRPAAP